MEKLVKTTRMKHFAVYSFSFTSLILGLIFLPLHVRASGQSQNQNSDSTSGQATSAPAASPQADQDAKQPDANSGKSQTDKTQSARERRRRDKKLHDELATPYKKWIDEDVTYIITPEERSSFLKLQTNEEREEFIEQFWLRRNPDPDSPENTFKEEHYRRIAYANEHFASGIPGWKTDRGRIYIMWGPPDEID